MIVILPTESLVSRLEVEEETFVFWPGGIRGVVSSMILNAELDNLRYYTHPVQKTKNQFLTISVIDKILFDYRNSPFSIGIFLNDRIDETARIDLTLEYIDEIIANMLLYSLQTHPFKLDKTYEKWVGNNLAIRLESS